MQGTFVYLDPDTGDYIGYNPVRAATRFVPASTYKIPHTVIALSEGVVADIDEVVPYGGRPQPFEVWERDMPLKEALKLSNAAVYQQVAGRIGLERMDKNIRNLCYGNMNIGNDVTTFWLDGPLKITALEQIRVIRDLVTQDLGYPPAAIAAMKA
ncbi:penicillin-binding transpeptidase domain-containing protein [Luteolibacter sp. AS25]|uniref:penicillin-binding transpeptidase domain-containing protein n=1 Tax=Luteolibacter sp. AS25 TaxID=3135776 RepID=UPI00398AA19B